ncbi:MAG: hypothetical protein WB919_07595, partial [Candidatus Sulfotelmatobacter sp.]
MSKRHSLWVLIVWLPLLGLTAFGQDNSPQQPTGTTPDNGAQQPVPAYGQDNSAPPSIAENPPISGIDMPNLEPHAAPLSYLQPGLHFGESVSTNLENSLGGSQTSTITVG